MLQILAEKREITGKKVKGLRKEGFVPAVVYGKGISPESISVKENEFVKVWRQAGESSLIELQFGGKKYNALIYDVSLHPTEDSPLHVDFYHVRMDEMLKIKVPLAFEGESPAVKNLGGILVKVAHELEVEALPADLPHELKLDLTRLEAIGDKLTVKDLKVLDKIKIMADPEETLVLVGAPRSEEEIAGETAPISLESIEVLGKKKVEEGEEAATGEAASTDRGAKET